MAIWEPSARISVVVERSFIAKISADLNFFYVSAVPPLASDQA